MVKVPPWEPVEEELQPLPKPIQKFMVRGDFGDG
jgi:hypothetical protein